MAVPVVQPSNLDTTDFSVGGVIAGKITANATNVTGASYNAGTGELTLTHAHAADTVISLPVENFLSAASYNAATNELTLTMANAATFTVDLNDLVDPVVITWTYTPGTSLVLDVNGTTTTVNLVEIQNAFGARIFDAIA